MPFDLEDRVKVALTDSTSELWFPHLTSELVQTGWDKLRKEVKLDRSSYGTARFLLNNPDAECNVISRLLFKNPENHQRDVILIEELTEEISSHYKKSGVDFYTQAQISTNEKMSGEILDCLDAAFYIIKQVPTLFYSVIDLVRCIHLIKPVSDDYDVSFSEPHIPFSIFVSIPKKNTVINALRVAEAIVHEAMHLQLTLIEAIIPLVFNSEEKFYSPWKDEHRTVGGVLHALYVFRILHSIFTNILDIDSILSAEKSYIEERRTLIVEQFTQTNDFANCAALTPLGKIFTQNLLNISSQ